MLTFSSGLEKPNWERRGRQSRQRHWRCVCVCVCVCVWNTHICALVIGNCSKCYTFPPPLYTAIIFLSMAAKLGFHTGNKNGCEIELMLRLKGNSLFFLFRELKLERKAPPCFPVHLKPSPTYLLVKNRVIGSGSEPGNFSVLALA